MTVTVTGAGGRTGRIVLQKLLAQPERFNARGLVRNEKVHAARQQMLPYFSAQLHNVVLCSC